MKPPIYPKKLDAGEKLFYHFKIDTATYSLFDSMMDTPIVFGSFNIVSAVVVKLPKNSVVYYFEVDASKGWKTKKVFKGDVVATAKDKADAE